MKKVAFETIGCRLNQYDTECIAADLKPYGFRRVDFEDTADLYIINTCTVTGRADATCRNVIARAGRREKPTVVVVGCYVDSDSEKVASLNGVDLVVNNHDKKNIVTILKKRFPELFENMEVATPAGYLDDFFEHNRAWIKIGDGCNQRCAYCVIPFVRGELSNRSYDDIINEINTLAAAGFEEIVLTGIHIGQYSYKNLNSPAALVKFILDNSDIKRLRLSSIEPQEVDNALIRVMADAGGRICRHLHIPMQSGSDRILKIMRRPYNIERYIDIIGLAKSELAGLILGADIIVGFPGEDEDDFQKSVEAANNDLIDYLHVFSYSDRPGTAASGLSDKVNPEIIKQRNHVLRAISNEHYARALKREVGKTAYVISEHKAKRGDHFWGISDNYLKTAIPEGYGGGRKIIKIEISDSTDNYLIGTISKNK